MADLTKDELDEIETRCNKATPGPWKFGIGPYYWDAGILQAEKEISFWSGVIMTNSGHGSTSLSEVDADFIAHSRSDVPALIAMARQNQELKLILLDVINQACQVEFKNLRTGNVFSTLCPLAHMRMP